MVAGPQKRTRLMNEKEKKITAYHEGGHALVAAALQQHRPGAQGDDSASRARSRLHDGAAHRGQVLDHAQRDARPARLHAWAAAPQRRSIFHDPTTGASNDIEKATKLARAMVMQYGMSDKVGAVRLGQGEGEVFLGRDMGHKRDYSEQMAEVIDAEVRAFLETAHQEAYEILSENLDVLDHLVVELLDRETLDQNEVAEVFSDIRKRDYREVWLSSTDRPVSDRGPVRSRKELSGGRQPRVRIRSRQSRPRPTGAWVAGGRSHRTV